MLIKFRTFGRQLLLLCIAVCVFSCSKTKDYVQTIPKDASYIVAIDGQALFKKGGFDKHTQFYNQFLEAAKQDMPVDQFKKMVDILKESSAGISFKDKIYFYQEYDMEIYTLLFKVKDEKKLKELFNLLVAEGAAIEIQENNAVNQYEIDRNFVCTFDKNLLQIATGADAGAEHHAAYQAYHMEHRTPEESILSNKAFQQLMKEKGDIQVMANWSAIPYEFRKEIPSSLPGNISPSEFTCLMNLNFEKGRLNITAEAYTENEKVKGLYKSMEKTYSKVSSVHMDKFPLSTFLYAAINIKGNEIYKALMEEPETKQALEELSGMINMENLLSAINGEVAVGLTDISIMTSTPVFVLFAEVNADKARSTLSQLKELMSMERGSRFTEVEKDKYFFRTPQGEFYFGLDKNTFYLTNDRILHQEGANSQSNSLKGGDWSADSRKGSSFVLLNLEAIMSHSAMRMLMALGGEQIRPVIDFWNTYSYIDVYTVTPQKVEFNIYMKDKEANFLEKSVSSMIDIAGLGFLQEMIR